MNDADERRQPKAAGIKDIARALNVSIGTVDRALHGRAGINRETQERVLRMAERLGYRPNVAARNLKLQRKLRIAVQLPREIAAFFDGVRQGIHEAALPFGDSVELVFHDVPRLGAREAQAFRHMLKSDVSGIIVAPGHPKSLGTLFARAASSGIPVVCVATDAPDAARLTAIQTDAYTSGAMAAELLEVSCEPGAAALVVMGDAGTQDHAEKLRGFTDEALRRKRLTIAAVVETHDDEQEAYRRVANRLNRGDGIRAVYVATANSMPVIQALQDAGRLREVKIVTTDLVPGLAPLIRGGRVLATIYQRPVTQGRLAFQALYQYLVQGTRLAERVALTPHLVLRSNLKLFLKGEPA